MNCSLKYSDILVKTKDISEVSISGSVTKQKESRIFLLFVTM